MASRSVDLPAPVSPQIAKRPAERSGSAVKSMTCSPSKEVRLERIILSIFTVVYSAQLNIGTFLFCLFKTQAEGVGHFAAVATVEHHLSHFHGGQIAYGFDAFCCFGSRRTRFRCFARHAAEEYCFCAQGFRHLMEEVWFWLFLQYAEFQIRPCFSIVLLFALRQFADFVLEQ